MKNDTKKILEFYMLANKLKYIKYNNKKDLSVANKIYNSIILAYAINSEYNKTDNIGEFIMKIIIDSIIKYNNSNNEILLNNNTSNTQFMENILILEKLLSNTLDNYLYTNLKEKDIIYLYKRITENNHKTISKYDKNYNIFRFYILNTLLNMKERSGWDKEHWNINSNRIERVSEHVIGTIALAIAINEYSDINVDINKVIEILTMHEIGEILIGDITPFDKITEEEKKKIEHKAMEEILGNLNISSKALKLLHEFDNQSTNDAKFAYLCDKLEADIQAKVYQDKGLQNSLDNQENNIVFKSEKIQEFLRNGANTAFEMFYLYDKTKYKDDPIFQKTLEYVKNNNLK